jgi:hypothetical protein
MVKIKKTKIIGGKILTVEVEVTPTPGPASNANPVEATPIASAPLPSATGYQLEVMKKLEIASNSPTGNMRFDGRMIATLREEFTKNKDKPHVTKILSPTESLKILSDLQRLSSIARGGNLEKGTAEKLLKALYPPPPKTLQAPGSESGPPQPGQPLSPPPGQPPVQQEPAPKDPQEQQQPQIYVDPQTGQYYYEDGTPVTTGEQQGQYYYDQEGNLFYEVNGQVYYEKDGQYYPVGN